MSGPTHGPIMSRSFEKTACKETGALRIAATIRNSHGAREQVNVDILIDDTCEIHEPDSGIILKEHLTYARSLYAPDYVVNAGGIINVSAEYLGETSRQVGDRVGQIAGRLLTILKRAGDEQVPPGVMADRLARQMIANAREREAA